MGRVEALGDEGRVANDAVIWHRCTLHHPHVCRQPYVVAYHDILRRVCSLACRGIKDGVAVASAYLYVTGEHTVIADDDARTLRGGEVSALHRGVVSYDNRIAAVLHPEGRVADDGASALYLQPIPVADDDDAAVEKPRLRSYNNRIVLARDVKSRSFQKRTTEFQSIPPPN